MDNPNFLSRRQQEEMAQSTDPSVLAELLAYTHARIPHLVARSKYANAETLKTIFKKHPEAHEALAKNPSLPFDIMQGFLSSRDLKIRAALATNLSLPLEIIEELASEGWADIRYGLARNKNISSDIINKLSNDPDKLVREVIAKRTDVPLAVLESLAQDPDDGVRTAVAANPKFNDPDRFVTDKAEMARVAIARRADTSVESLRILAQDSNDYIREQVLQNPNTPLDVSVEVAKTVTLVRHYGDSDVLDIAHVLDKIDNKYTNLIDDFLEKLNQASTDETEQELIQKAIKRRFQSGS